MSEVVKNRVKGYYLVEQLLSVVIEGFMGEHTLVAIHTVACGVEQLTGKFT